MEGVSLDPGFDPKYTARFEKRQNSLTGYGIRPLLGKRDSPKSWPKMRNCREEGGFPERDDRCWGCGIFVKK